jgi:RNA recognition motif-containing protein
VIKDHNTGNSRGFAYITYVQPDEASTAIKQMDGSAPFNDWQIKVEHAKRGKPFDASGQTGKNQGKDL